MGKCIASSFTREADHGVGFLYDNCTVFHKGAPAEIQRCSCPHPGSCCGYRVPRGTKSDESKAADVNAAALSPISAASKGPTSLPCEI